MSQFSIVIATHNRCEYVLESIQSVKDQTYAAHEIIVISDGSPDDTVRQVREKFPEVILIEQPNLGPSLARNTGVAAATGEWICMLDDDDLWHREKLEAIVQYLDERPDTLALNHPVWYFASEKSGPTHYGAFVRDIVARNLEECHRLTAGEDTSPNSYDFLQIEGNSFRLLLERARGLLSATVVRRDILIRAGVFSPMQRNGEDWTTFINVARMTEWRTIPRRLGFTRVHPTQTTNDYTSMVYILGGQVTAWYGGCPLLQPSRNLDFIKDLKSYGWMYRITIQDYFWYTIRRGQWRTSAVIWSLGKLLLPGSLDRLYALTPPQITWRWERYVLGRHK